MKFVQSADGFYNFKVSFWWLFLLNNRPTTRVFCQSGKEENIGISLDNPHFRNPNFISTQSTFIHYGTRKRHHFHSYGKHLSHY